VNRKLLKGYWVKGILDLTGFLRKAGPNDKMLHGEWWRMKTKGDEILRVRTC
jgi:hypothetical protein